MSFRLREYIAFYSRYSHSAPKDEERRESEYTFDDLETGVRATSLDVQSGAPECDPGWMIWNSRGSGK